MKFKSSAETVIPAEGTYRARNFWIFDLGTQESSFNGKPTLKHRIRLDFELSDTKYDFGKGLQPFSVRQEQTANLQKGNFAKFLGDWRGRALTPEESVPENALATLRTFFGKPCMITVAHKLDKDPSKTGKTTIINQDGSARVINGTKVYANISSITPIPKEIKNGDQIIQHAVAKPNPINPDVWFDIDADDAAKIFAILPEFTQKTIAQSPEWQERFGQGGANSVVAGGQEFNQSSADEF